MPHITASRHSPTVEPVSDVLRRIQVRDPNRKPTGIFGRRLADYENRSPIRQAVITLALAAMAAGSLWIVFLQPWTGIWTTQTPASPALMAPRPPVEMSSMPSEKMQNLPVKPENLHVRFWGPRMLEFYWDPIGQEYNYRLYSAESQEFQNPQPLSEDPIQGTHMAWMPNNNVQRMWVALKGIDPQGRETAFSRPLLVRLPTE